MGLYAHRQRASQRAPRQRGYVLQYPTRSVVSLSAPHVVPAIYEPREYGRILKERQAGYLLIMQSTKFELGSMSEMPRRPTISGPTSDLRSVLVCADTNP
jgi:hypothetical protein